MDTKFPIHVKPLKDELLSSWVLRLSKALKTKYHTFWDFTFQGADLDVRDIDLNISEKQLKQLAQLTYLPYEKIYSTTLKSYYPYLSLDTGLRNWVLTQGSLHRVAKNNFIAYCPLCLKSDSEPYFRKNWRLIHSVTCTKCGVYLRDSCPKCQSPVDFLRLDIGRKEQLLKDHLATCSSCGFDLTKSKTEKCDIELLEFQKTLERYLEAGYTEKLPYSHLYFEVVYLLMKLLNSQREKMRGFDHVVSEKSGHSPQKALKQRAVELKNLPVDTRLSLLRKVCWLLNLDEEEFIKTCKNAKMWSCFLFYETHEVPYWFYRIGNEYLSIKYTEWKKQYPELSYEASYTRLGETITRRSSQK